MKNRGSILLAFVLFQAFSVGAQAKLVVNAPDSLSFLLFVDDVQCNTLPVSSIQVSKVNVGKHNVKVVVEAQESIFLLNAKNLFSHSLTVSVLNNMLVLVPTGELKLQAKAFQFWNNNAILVAVKDSVYVGKKGCESPASPSTVDSIVAVLYSKSFDTERKMIARGQLESDCYLVKDIVQIISTIELEENRMDCISASLDHVYDLTAINELLELVILERNKEALQQKISQLQNQ
jgi:hypothetical protein